MDKAPENLVDRTFRFAQDVRRFVNQLERSLAMIEDARQLVRASGSVAANYLEAQEGLSRKDFFYRIKVCRKEAREAGLWLRLLDLAEGQAPALERDRLVDEADQLKKIFATIASRESGK